MEARPGEEVQVDFGWGAQIDDGASRLRRSWVFRMVLSYSRKAYSEAVSSSGHRNVPALSGKRLTSLRRCAAPTQSGQL